jgi:hypothetical protein
VDSVGPIDLLELPRSPIAAIIETATAGAGKTPTEIAIEDEGDEEVAAVDAEEEEEITDVFEASE